MRWKSDVPSCGRALVWVSHSVVFLYIDTAEVYEKVIVIERNLIGG